MRTGKGQPAFWVKIAQNVPGSRPQAPVVSHAKYGHIAKLQANQNYGNESGLYGWKTATHNLSTCNLAIRNLFSMENPVIIFGAKGLGRVALDIFQSNGVVVYGLLDDDKTLYSTDIQNVPVLGSPDDDGFLKLIGKKCEAFVATDDNKLRRHLTEMLNERRKTMPVNAVHNLAHIAPSAGIGHGNLLAAGVVVGSAAVLGSHCVLHTGCAVDYESRLGDYVQVGAGSVIGSGATVENGVFIGSGVTVVPGVTIGKNARVGAGSVVIENIKAGATVFGNPAKAV